MKLKQFMHKPGFKIAGLTYKVAWCKVVDEAATLGFCDDVSQIIYMKDGQPVDETFKTMIHELMHAIDHAYGIKLRHAQVRKLELALSEFLIQNEIIK